MPPPLVAILLCTHNGAPHLFEQLESISAQDYPNWRIYISDDGSVDATRRIIEAYAARFPCTALKNGPLSGFAQNFLSLITDTNIDAQYFAFCDQDDVWLPNHLDRAIKSLELEDSNTPSVYCSRTKLIDNSGAAIGMSPLFDTVAPCFRNALVHNIASGNTMIFNRAARELLARTSANISIVSHDWWLYLVVTAVGGRFNYDTEPSVLYRQHRSNLIGSGHGWRGKWHVTKKLFVQNQVRCWNSTHEAALKRVIPWMTASNRKVFKKFVAARHGATFFRPFRIWSAGLRHQTKIGNVVILLTALLDRSRA